MFFFFSLLHANSWCIISASLGLNALIKSNNEKARLKAAAPPPTHVVIDTTDVTATGAAATAACTLAGLVIFPVLATHLYHRHKNTLSPRTLRALAATLVFSALLLVASLIPFTFFFATRSARVTATIGSVVIPASTIQQIERSLGATPIYSKKTYRAFLSLPKTSGSLG
jgi:hypothetical protein